jgi:hypothetical protein
LAWAASTDTGNSQVASYRVERCTGAGCGSFVEIQSVSAAALSAVDTTVTGGYTYQYRVRAVDGAGNASGYSNVASATTPAPVPATPTITANPDETTIDQLVTVRWSAVANATHYELEHAAGTGAFAPTYSGAETFLRSRLARGTHRFRVRACNGGLCSPHSAVVQVNICAATGCN